MGADDGLFRFTADHPKDRWQVISLGHGEQPKIRAIQPTPEGDLWLGTRSNGLIWWSAQGIRRFGPQNGLPSDIIRSIWRDPDGFLWLSTETAGLVWVDPKSADSSDGILAMSIKDDNGTLPDAVHHVVADDFGDLWLSTNEGIFRGALDDFRAVTQGTAQTVPLTRYTERHGMLDREANGDTQAAGLKDREGRIVFVTQQGLVRFDPSLKRPDEPLPKAYIDSLQVGRSPLDIESGEIALNPRQRSFSINFSAPDLRSAEGLRFRARLWPYQSEWQDLGTRRTAFYTQVPAGDYRFEVTVAQQQLPHRGQWNPDPAVLQLRITPKFHETWIFKLLCLLLSLSLVAAGVRWRVGHLRRRAEHLELMVARRTATIAEQTAQLRRLDRVKSDLFANVSHEFRTPLTLIIGSLQDSRGNKLEPRDRDSLLELAQKNARRLLNLVDQLLDVAKVDSGGLKLNLRQERVDELLRRALEHATPLAEREQVQLKHLKSQALTARIDATQLEKVVDNLLGNALKFVPAGGRVELALKSDGNHFEIKVRDNGPGISAEDLERVFERFHQAGHESRYGGSGLGLTLAKQIVELHGGVLTVESVKGEGATFTARLPLNGPAAETDPSLNAAIPDLDRAAPTTVSEPKAVAEPAQKAWRLGSGVTLATSQLEPAIPGARALGSAGSNDSEDRAQILVVDDNADLRAYLRRHLAPKYHVLEAEDGRVALQLAREHRPDVVVSDIMMPHLDGRALFRHLRQDPELELIPVILVTAMASADNRLEGLREGVDDYLVKPFDPQELMARLGNILSSRRRWLDRVAPPESLVDGPFDAQLPSADQSFLNKVRQVIERHLDDSDLTVEKLAREVGCDRSHLLRKLRTLVDESPSSMIRTVRLQRAEQLLRSNAGRVNEIAYSVGFKSLSHFSNTFNKEFGERPSAFAARYRKQSAPTDLGLIS